MARNKRRTVKNRGRWYVPNREPIRTEQGLKSAILAGLVRGWIRIQIVPIKRRELEPEDDIDDGGDDITYLEAITQVTRGWAPAGQSTQYQRDQGKPFYDQSQSAVRVALSQAGQLIDRYGVVGVRVLVDPNTTVIGGGAPPTPIPPKEPEKREPPKKAKKADVILSREEQLSRSILDKSEAKPVDVDPAQYSRALRELTLAASVPKDRPLERSSGDSRQAYAYSLIGYDVANKEKLDYAKLAEETGLSKKSLSRIASTVRKVQRIRKEM